jgi:hypothetical protein
VISRILKLLAGPQAQTRPASTANIGAFQGHDLPQDPRAALTREILPTMSGTPGIRLAASTAGNSQFYRGTDQLPPIRFPLTGPPKVNQPKDLETAAFKPN